MYSFFDTRYRSNRFGVGIGVPQIFRTLGLALGMETWLTPTSTLLPTCVTVPNLVVLGEIVWISAFQGHSR